MAKVYLSPSCQYDNAYAYGNTTEGVQCVKISNACKAALQRSGISVMTPTTNSLVARCTESDRWGANLHVPIHTNAYNGKTSGTRVYYYSGSAKGSKAAKAIFDVLAPFTPGKSESVSANNGLLEVNTPDAPTAYVEVDFHDVPSIAKWITENTTAIGEKIAQGICKYFGVTYKAASSTTTNTAVKPTTATVKIDAPNLSEYLEEGDKSLAVYSYKQQLMLLKKKGIISQGVDNNEIFGAGTKTATMQVQRAAGITVDGLAGPQTIRACYVLAAK
nr:MAG TPA: Cell wall hydrolase autolysin [Caudoviricetes sp.]